MSEENKTEIDPMRVESELKPKNRSRSAAITAGVIVLLAVLFVGNFHFISSSTGPLVLRKDRFTLAESFVSLDDVIDQPKGQPRRFPLAFAALQREGIIQGLQKTFTGRKLSESEIASHKAKHGESGGQVHLFAHPVPRPADWAYHQGLKGPKP